MKQLASESPSCWRAWSPGAQLWPNLSRFVIFVYLVSVLDLLCYTVPKYWCYTGYTGAMLGCALLFQDSRLDIMLAKSGASWNLMERKFLGISLWVVETIKSWRWFSCCCFVLLFFLSLITAKDPGGSTWMGLGDFAKRYLGANQVPRANRYHGSLACKYSQRKLSKHLKWSPEGI